MLDCVRSSKPVRSDYREGQSDQIIGRVSQIRIQASESDQNRGRAHIACSLKLSTYTVQDEWKVLPVCDELIQEGCKRC